MEITVTTARLIRISSAHVVAVGGAIHFDWNGVTAPTLLLVLRCRENKTLVIASGDATIVRVVSVSIRRCSKLPTRVVLLEASYIPILRGSIWKKWADLLSNRIADELELLLPHVRVTCVHCPDSATIVAGHINLRFGHRAI